MTTRKAPSRACGRNLEKISRGREIGRKSEAELLGPQEGVSSLVSKFASLLVIIPHGPGTAPSEKYRSHKRRMRGDYLVVSNPIPEERTWELFSISLI